MKSLRMNPQSYEIELKAKDIDEPGLMEIYYKFGEKDDFIVVTRGEAELIGKWFTALAAEMGKKKK